MDTLGRWCARPAALLACSAAALPGRAYANGAFPAVSQLVADPSDPAHLVLRSNFGLLTTHDQGANWDLVCEAGIGYQNIEPPIAVLDDGVTIVALQDGIAHDTGTECAFAHGSGITSYVADVARVPGSPHEAVAVSVDLDRNASQVWRTTDGGRTWSVWGTSLSDLNAETLDVAGDASHVYVSGFSVSAGVSGSLVHTTDAGQHWARHVIPIAGKLNAPFIAAVASEDPDTLYVRLAGAPGQLLVTHDAGQHVDRVLDFQGSVDGFALSPDGQFALASSRVDGVWRAPTNDLSFERLSCAKLRCLSWSAAGLFACADEFEAGFLVGESSDQGASFSARLHESCVRGPRSCAASSSVGSVCPAAWPAISEQLGSDCSAAGSFTPSTSCSSGAAGDGGAAGDSGEVSAVGEANAGGGSPTRPRGGCAFAAARNSPLPWTACGCALFALFRRRKRRVENAGARC